MAKRFTDTDVFKKQFMRSLPGPYKLFWFYLYHECNHAGIWEVEFEVAQVRIGLDMKIDKETALEWFNKDEERVRVLNHGSKWLIIPFIDFQYGDLNSTNNCHKSIIDVLVKSGVGQGFLKGRSTAMDMEKDKDKDKESITAFEEFWKSYPCRNGKRVGKAKTYSLFRKIKKYDRDDVLTACRNYEQSDGARRGYAKDPERFLRNDFWRDWITPEQKPEVESVKHELSTRDRSNLSYHQPFNSLVQETARSLPNA